MNIRNKIKKGFTLVELAIALAVIAALSVTFTFSEKIVDNAKATQVMQNINKTNTNIEQFYQILETYPAFFNFQTCIESELNIKNICRASYCKDEDDLHVNFNTNNPCSGNEYSEYQVFTPAYWMNQFMSVSSHLNAQGVRTETGEYKNLSETLFTSEPDTSNVKTNLKYALESATTISRNQMLAIGTVDAFGTLDNIAVSTSDIAPIEKIKHSIIISFINKDIQNKAAFTSNFTRLLDVKFDDGKPNTGKIIASKHRLNPACYDGTLKCGGSGKYQKTGNSEESSLTNLGDYACYNTTNAGTGTDQDWLITENDNIEYTSHAKTDHTNTIDISGISKSFKKSQEMGCDIHYISSHRIR